MPIKWTAETRNILLLAMMHTQKGLSKVQIQQVIDLWPENPAPSVRAVEEQVKALRNEAKARFGGDGSPSKVTKTPITTPRKSRTPTKPQRTPRSSTPSKSRKRAGKPEDSDEAEMSSDSSTSTIAAPGYVASGRDASPAIEQISPKRTMPDRNKSKPKPSGRSTSVITSDGEVVDDMSDDPDFVVERQPKVKSWKEKISQLKGEQK